MTVAVEEPIGPSRLDLGEFGHCARVALGSDRKIGSEADEVFLSASYAHANGYFRHISNRLKNHEVRRLLLINEIWGLDEETRTDEFFRAREVLMAPAKVSVPIGHALASSPHGSNPS